MNNPLDPTSHANHAFEINKLPSQCKYQETHRAGAVYRVPQQRRRQSQGQLRSLIPELPDLRVLISACHSIHRDTSPHIREIDWKSGFGLSGDLNIPGSKHGLLGFSIGSLSSRNTCKSNPVSKEKKPSCNQADCSTKQGRHVADEYRQGSDLGLRKSATMLPLSFEYRSEAASTVKLAIAVDRGVQLQGTIHRIKERS